MQVNDAPSSARRESGTAGKGPEGCVTQHEAALTPEQAALDDVPPTVVAFVFVTRCHEHGNENGNENDTRVTVCVGVRVNESVGDSPTLMGRS